ncbi:MAG: gliding motility-associated ABC transporter permease subunit GldF [Saprospiraceae bacterium]|nr:gliding motility-associated ABC transporter permease subunit GldF [Saprospiraceae bacterium]MBK8451563.1 gliding motility-associated ABC transporter permease subunit GldF [Saprospiraceae bacterium]MBK9221041.1 gliding motility-associated ABC transporter permease subunit GldF [Saprospiraceae bacterium]MBK9722107.1 gliding motility-associated ABC transporter permease subunit GldF [Saprospiraceae bacterium]MBK9729154.1 gliding motility-associated ABC transporter permease subunit GldF [Saprospir
MWTILKKEVSSFFSSLIGYVVIGLFVLILGLIMWVFPDFSILYYNYASLDQLFSLAPLIFIFLIPAITMRSFSEELQNGTLEILLTKPIHEFEIVLGKYLACLSLVGIALCPTLLYFYSVYQLGSPAGNIDTGAVLGSYIGLVFLAAGFTAIGIFCSSLFKNQIVSFLFSTALAYIFYFGFYFISKLPVFFGKTDDIIQQFGMDYHFNSISKGLIDTSDIIYFLSIVLVFNYLTVESLKRRNF